MKTKMILIVAVGFAIFSCSNRQDSSSSDEISGAYAREYFFKVVNPETGSELGMRRIRDTIFIKPFEYGYEVSNRKWKRNDYDKDGWKSMEHSDDRPITKYKALFHSADSILTSETTSQSLYLDLRKKQLYKGKQSNISYKQVK